MAAFRIPSQSESFAEMKLPGALKIHDLLVLGFRVVELEQRLLELLPDLRGYAAPGHPHVVDVRRRGPEYVGLAGVDRLLVDELLPHQEVQRAGIDPSGRHPGRGGVMGAAEAELLEVPFGLDPGRLEEVARHQVSGCRAYAAEGEGLALEVRQGLDAGVPARDEDALEAGVFLAHGQPGGALGPLRGLDRGETAVPDDVQPVRRQALHGGGVVHHRNELDLHPHLFLDVVGEGLVLPQQLLRVFVRDRGNPQRVRGGDPTHRPDNQNHQAQQSSQLLSHGYLPKSFRLSGYQENLYVK